MQHQASLSLQAGTLYVVATPLGNLADLSPRAQEVLRQVELIAAEDTRVTQTLLRAFGIQTPLVSLREHNEREMAAKLLPRLQAGGCIAQVSDAGTPAISDPGARFVEQVLAAGLRVSPIPGPSALTAAVSAAGFLGDGVFFAGFPPAKQQARRQLFERFSHDPAVLVVYEAPHRLYDCLEDMHHSWGAAREVALCRELSKTFETVHRAPLGDLLEWAKTQNQARGECVLVVAPAQAEAASMQQARHTLALLLEELPPAVAARLAARLTGVKKSELYQEALRLKGDADAD